MEGQTEEQKDGQTLFYRLNSTNPEDCHLKVNSVMLIYAKIIALQQAKMQNAKIQLNS